MNLLWVLMPFGSSSLYILQIAIVIEKSYSYWSFCKRIPLRRGEIEISSQNLFEVSYCYMTKWTLIEYLLHLLNESVYFIVKLPSFIFLEIISEVITPPPPNQKIHSHLQTLFPCWFSSYVESFEINFFLTSDVGWKERFTVILGSDEVKSGKPSPDM